MAAIALGLIAALAWGLHDLAVRYVSQRVSIYVALFSVLLAGFVLLAPVLIIAGVVGPISNAAAIKSAASGVAFAGAGVALYKAFSIGPVRLVAPVIGAFPVLSVGQVAVTGTTVPLTVWTAVLAVVAGIAVVSGRSGTSSRNRALALLWSALAAVLFFVTFQQGQAAAQASETGASLLIARGAAAAVILGVLMLRRETLWPRRDQVPLLVGMGAADATALSAVVVAGNLPNPTFAVVGSSIFGIVTIILARVFLGEPMSPRQWIGVALVFTSIGYLAVWA